MAHSTPSSLTVLDWIFFGSGPTAASYVFCPDRVWPKTPLELDGSYNPRHRSYTISRASQTAAQQIFTRQSGDPGHPGMLKRDCNRPLQTLHVETLWTHQGCAPRRDATKTGSGIGRQRGACKGAGATAHILHKIFHTVLKRGDILHTTRSEVAGPEIVPAAPNGCRETRGARDRSGACHHGASSCTWRRE